jgi:hypothetical protein
MIAISALGIQRQRSTGELPRIAESRTGVKRFT